MSTTPVIYNGPHDAVDVALPSGLTATCGHGETVELPAAIAAALIEQGYFAPAPPAKPKTKTDAADGGQEGDSNGGR